jgi:hypothetical protein
MARPKKRRSWPTRELKGRTIPYGWCLPDPDSKLLQPVVQELELLEEAIAHLANGTSTDRKLATWINGLTGRSLSHMGLRVAIKYFKKNRVKEIAIARAEAEDRASQDEG